MEPKNLSDFQYHKLAKRLKTNEKKIVLALILACIVLLFLPTVLATFLSETEILCLTGPYTYSHPKNLTTAVFYPYKAETVSEEDLVKCLPSSGINPEALEKNLEEIKKITGWEFPKTRYGDFGVWFILLGAAFDLLLSIVAKFKKMKCFFLLMSGLSLITYPLFLFMGLSQNFVKTGSHLQSFKLLVGGYSSIIIGILILILAIFYYKNREYLENSL